MKKRGVILAAALLSIVALWRANQDPKGHERAKASGHGMAGGVPNVNHTDDARLPTKSGARPDDHHPAATHSPERLREFYLPEADIDGLKLEAALQKLVAAYEEVCRETGESPLRLTFTVPPGHDRPLTVKLGAKTLDASIRMLAAVSGLKVVRKGSEYLFEAPAETGAQRTMSLRVPPDFYNAPEPPGDPFKEPAPPSKISPADYFAGKGITLDPETRLRYSSATGSVVLTTTRAADEVAVSGLIDFAFSETPGQHKLETQIIKLPAGIEWTPPDTSQFDDAGLQEMMRTFAQRNGVELITIPTTTVRSNEERGGLIEIGRELITPLEAGGFETRWVGINMQLKAGPVGFGQDVALRFTDTAEDVDPASGNPIVTTQTDISAKSFTGDGVSQLHLQTSPDGTRTLLLVKPTLIDATGRPVRGGE